MALINKLSAIGDAIREKTGKTVLLTLDQMPAEIKAIETGGEGFPEEAFVITGDCRYRFSYEGWNWFIEKYGDKITTADITNMGYMFSSSITLTNIPFEINCKSNTNIGMDSMFSSCYKLTELPKVNNVKPISMTSMFSYCQSLREIPEDWCDTWDWSYMDGLTSSYSGNMAYRFYNCYSLRKYSNSFLEHGNPVINYSYSIYTNTFQNCYCLDEIIDLPFPHYKASWASNAFTSFCQSCYRLKNITFALQEDGTPYVMKWKSQTIDLSSYVGYALYDNYLKKAGFTTDTKITNDATYQALKDNPDSWTTDINYSRYNHTSAVNTINSLPNCSATGTNTIKFKGASGALTDGGAINTLTEEEIAVAIAKGWTVSLV